MAFNRYKSPSPQRDHYQEVTDAIISAFESGVMPWRAGWDKAACGLPINPTTGRIYRGINLLLLSLGQAVKFGGDPRWCSYRQAQARGWQIRRGERGTTVVFYKKMLRTDVEKNDGPLRYYPLLRTSTVFNATQIDNVPEYVPPELRSVAWQAPDATDVIVRNSRVDLRFGGAQPFFSPSTDHIQMPPVEAFESAEAYSKTLVHELGHWAFAANRLDLSKGGRFGSSAYAAEELRVEISASMVCATLGIDPLIQDTAAYVGNWLKSLRDDKREIFRAAADAQRVADYLLAFHPEYSRNLAVHDDADAEDPTETNGDPMQEAA